jgi:hypothetical protein
VRGAPNWEMAVDWRVSPWRGGNGNGGGQKRHRHGQDACWLGRGRRREGVSSGAVGAESNGGVGQKFSRRWGWRALKVAWWGGNGGGSGGEGATRRNLTMGPGPDRRATSRPRPQQRRARATRLSSSRGAPGAADAWTPASSERGREERDMGAHGPTRRKREVGRAGMNSDDF